MVSRVQRGPRCPKADSERKGSLAGDENGLVSSYINHTILYKKHTRTSMWVPCQQRLMPCPLP